MAELTVGVRELKSRLSEVLRRANAGQTVLITDHGQPARFRADQAAARRQPG